MNIKDLHLSEKDENSLRERIKDFKISSPTTTTHPIDYDIKKLGLVHIKAG